MYKISNIIAFYVITAIITISSYEYAWGAGALSPTTHNHNHQVAALSREAAENLVMQMNSTMNSRMPNLIKSFFEYHIEPDAIIHQKGIVMSANKPDEVTALPGMDYTRAMYVTILAHTPKGQYNYEATLNGFEIVKDGSSAVLNIGIKEINLNSTSDDLPNSIIPPFYMRNFVKNDCSVTVVSRNSIPVMTGANCIAKVSYLIWPKGTE